MPVYEYLCQDCRRTVSIFYRSFSAQADPVCPECGGTRLRRKISRVIIARGGRRFLNEVDTGRLMGEYGGRDKKSQAEWARRVAGELGEAGSDFREMAEKVEAGQDVWDLYDPGPMLEHRIREKAETEGPGPAEPAEPPSEAL